MSLPCVVCLGRAFGRGGLAVAVLPFLGRHTDETASNGNAFGNDDIEAAPFAMRPHRTDARPLALFLEPRFGFTHDIDMMRRLIAHGDVLSSLECVHGFS